MTSSPLLLGQSQLYKAGVGLAVSGQRYSSESLDLAPALESPGLRISQGGGSLPRVTVTVAERVQVQVVVITITIRGEGVDDMPSALLVIPAAPVSVLEFA